jgi:acylphosphatase
MRRLHVYFSGTVQGVGFRYAVVRCAEGFPVRGWVRNLSDGRVEMVAEGDEGDLENLLRKIEELMEGYITSKLRSWEPCTGEFSAFEIKPTH